MGRESRRYCLGLPYCTSRGSSSLGARCHPKNCGGFCLVHISTSFEDCEKRDRKGLYKKARDGLLKGLTGLDDPYETPEMVELTIDTGIDKVSVADACSKVVDWLTGEFYLKGQGDLQ